MGMSAGGVFLPGDPPPSTSQVLTTPVIASPTMTGTMTGTFTVSGATMASPALTAPVISGAATVASGATFTTPTMLFTTALVTATGATGGSGAVLPTVTPAFVTITGATGSGVDLLTGTAGQVFFFNNATATITRIYCVGGTINGTTGTTAFQLATAGNKFAMAVNTTATGAWLITGNT